jgi:uncharacterized protein
MPVPPVILNNTPLVALWSIDQLDLLKALFGTVWIPMAVAMEFLATETAVRQQALARATWLQIVALTNPRHALSYSSLDRGEAEVLALAVEHEARLVIIDERKGRQYARRLGLPLTGTLGVLLLAKEKGLITTVAPLVQQMQDTGLYFSPDLVSEVLSLAREIE